MFYQLFKKTVHLFDVDALVYKHELYLLQMTETAKTNLKEEKIY